MDLNTYCAENGWEYCEITFTWFKPEEDDRAVTDWLQSNGYCVFWDKGESAGRTMTVEEFINLVDNS